MSFRTFVAHLLGLQVPDAGAVVPPNEAIANLFRAGKISEAKELTQLVYPDAKAPVAYSVPDEYREVVANAHQLNMRLCETVREVSIAARSSVGDRASSAYRENGTLTGTTMGIRPPTPKVQNATSDDNNVLYQLKNPPLDPNALGEFARR